jgi:hypothetical protein
VVDFWVFMADFLAGRLGDEGIELRGFVIWCVNLELVFSSAAKSGTCEGLSGALAKWVVRRRFEIWRDGGRGMLG